MKDHIRAVAETLRFGNPGFLPRGELFITQNFLDRFFPHMKGDCLRQTGAAAAAMGLSLVGLDLNEGTCALSASRAGAEGLEDRFVTGYINGPVSRMIDTHGFANAMIGMRKRPELLSEASGDFLRHVATCVEASRDLGLSAIAIADDIAGSNGLLFSFDYFRDKVCPVYEAAASIIKERGLFTFFHSDGDMRKTIDSLIMAGYDCLHPVDTLGGLDLYSLRQEFGDRLAFMGHMDVMAWEADRIVAETDRAEREFERGGLILGSMGGISVEAKHGALRALYPGVGTLIPE